MLPLLLSLVLLLALVAPAPAPAPAPADAPLVGGRPNSRALVVALHGGSWTGRTPPQLAERMRAELDGEARRAGLRLVVPVAPASSEDDAWQVPWRTAAGEALVLRVISDELEGGRVDPRRIHLAGHGAGATGALHLAARHPELIAGVAAWSGAPSPLWDDERRVVGLADDPVAGLREVAVYLWTGVDDEHLDRAALALLTAGLRRQRDGPGALPLVIESGEGGHGYGPGPRAGLRFLALQRKPARR
jgi:pimeloyl-ACP methyl ester carboxylesterase